MSFVAILQSSSWKVCSLDVDLPRLRRRRLRHHDTQDAILETSLHSILIDPGRESKAAMELANTTLTDPVLGLGRLVLRCNLLLLRLLSDFRVLVTRFCGLVLDGGLVSKFLLLFTILDEALRPLTFFADVFVATRDSQRVVVRPLNVYVLLVNTGKFAVEFVAVLGLLDVEFGGEGADALELTVNALEGLAVVLIKEAEDGSELLGEAWEERHCCWCC